MLRAVPQALIGVPGHALCMVPSGSIKPQAPLVLAHCPGTPGGVNDVIAKFSLVSHRPCQEYALFIALTELVRCEISSTASQHMGFSVHGRSRVTGVTRNTTIPPTSRKIWPIDNQSCIPLR